MSSRMLPRLARVLLPGVVAVGCVVATAGNPLADAQPGDEVLVVAVLDALARRDTTALRGYLVARAEYEDLLWPEMPDGQHTPFEFVWGLNEVSSRKGLRQMLAHYGGMPLELVSITFPEQPEVYESFSLHQRVDVKVRRLDTGEEGILPSIDVLVDYGGGWKLLNYDEL